MGAFEDFITIELPKRVWALADGASGQIPVRSTNADRRMELVWIDAPGANVSADPDNAAEVGTDGGIFVQQFKWTTTQW